MANKPNYRSLSFWEDAEEEIKEIIYGIEFHPNTFDHDGTETGAHVLLLYGVGSQCELQLSYGNTPSGVASIMLAHCDDLPGTYHQKDRDTTNG